MSLDDGALDAAARLIHVEHIPQRGNVARRISTHDDIGEPTGGETARHRAHPDGVRRPGGTGDDGVSVREPRARIWISCMNSPAAYQPQGESVPAIMRTPASLIRRTASIRTSSDRPDSSSWATSSGVSCPSRARASMSRSMPAFIT